MSRGRKHCLHIVLFSGGHGADPLAASALCPIFTDRQPLYIAAVSQREDALLFFNEILNVYLICHVLNFSHPLIAVLVSQGDKLILQDSLDKLRVSKKSIIIFYLLLQLLVLLLKLLTVQPLQRDKTHVAYGLRLHIRQAKTSHKVLFCVVVAVAYNVDDLVNIVLGNKQTFQQMSPLKCFFQIISCAADYYILLKCQIFVQNMPQGEYLGLGLVVYQCQHVD